MNFDPGLEQLRGDQATFESAQELSHIFSYNLRPKKLFLVWVDFPSLFLKVASFGEGDLEKWNLCESNSRPTIVLKSAPSANDYPC